MFSHDNLCIHCLSILTFGVFDLRSWVEEERDRSRQGGLSRAANEEGRVYRSTPNGGFLAEHRERSGPEGQDVIGNRLPPKP